MYRSLIDNSNLATEQINLYKYEKLLLLYYYYYCEPFYYDITTKSIEILGNYCHSTDKGCDPKTVLLS